jgi:hypothetical protein
MSAGSQADVVAMSLCLAPQYGSGGELTLPHRRGGQEGGQRKGPLRAAGGQREAAGRWGEPSAAHAGGGPRKMRIPHLSRHRCGRGKQCSTTPLEQPAGILATRTTGPARSRSQRNFFFIYGVWQPGAGTGRAAHNDSRHGVHHLLRLPGRRARCFDCCSG